MPEIDFTQTRLKLTDNKQVLSQLKDNRALHKDEQGVYFVMQFDSKEFRFRPGAVYPVAKNIADRLIADSFVIVGDHLTGPQIPALVRDGNFQLGEESVTVKRKNTACPLCEKDQRTFPRLARHLMKAHKSERPEYYKDPETQAPESTQWDADEADDAAAE